MISSEVVSIIKALEEDIMFNVLSPKSHLIEELISNRFKVKRHVVRQAFFHLGEMGLINRIPNKGVWVNELTPKETKDIYDVRKLIESNAIQITPLPVDKEIIQKMKKIHNELIEATKKEDFRTVFRLNTEFHMAQYSACPNRELENLIYRYSRKSRLITATMITYGNDTYSSKIKEQHLSIIEAMQNHSQEELIKIVKQHLNIIAEDYIRLYEIRYGKTI